MMTGSHFAIVESNIYLGGLQVGQAEDPKEVEGRVLRE